MGSADMISLSSRMKHRHRPCQRSLAATIAHAIFCAAVATLCWFSSAAPADASPSKGALQIYFVDVEGGQATLFVTPEKQALLIDTGWPGNNGRDADRIVAAAKDAGVGRIDYVLVTHFHEDHVGGAPQLAARIPVGTFIDHGENRESTDKPTVQMWQAYKELLGTGKYKHIVVKAGDTLPVRGMRATVVSSDGAVLDAPLPGAGEENSNCKNAEQVPADQTENQRSVGTLITFGRLRILDLGDLTKDKEMQLMCPKNKLGKVDIYIVSAPRMEPEQQSGTGVRNHPASRHHGQWSQEGRHAFGLGHNRKISGA